MTESECKQAYASMSASQLLPHLQLAETALKEVWDIAVRHQHLTEQRSNAVHNLSHIKTTASIKTVITFLAAAGSLLFFILSDQSRNLAALLWKLPAYFCMIFAVIAFFTLLHEWKSLLNLKKSVPQLESELKEITAQLEQVKEKNNAWLVIRAWICPPEYSYPEHMRMFVSYFEDGRVSSMKEARNLFDQYIHRVRMENTANAQLAAVRADDARIAAQNAAFTAQQAKYSADRAAYQTRNN